MILKYLLISTTVLINIILVTIIKSMLVYVRAIFRGDKIELLKCKHFYEYETNILVPVTLSPFQFYI